jgi:hypothetical protein
VGSLLLIAHAASSFLLFDAEADPAAKIASLARKKTPAGKIARALKRTEGATRQKAFSLGLSLDSRL